MVASLPGAMGHGEDTRIERAREHRARGLATSYRAMCMAHHRC
jgi:hypothetical protein